MKIPSVSLPQHNLLNYQNIIKPVESAQRPLQLEFFRVNGQKFDTTTGNDSTLDSVDIDFSPKKVNPNEIKNINNDIGKIEAKEAEVTKSIDALNLLLEKMDRITSYDTYVPTKRIYRELRDINKSIERLKKENVISSGNTQEQGGLALNGDNIVKVRDVIDVPLQYFESEAFGYVKYEIGNNSGKKTLVSNDKNTGLGEVAEKLNKFYGDEGVEASAEVVFKPFTDANMVIKAGKTPSDFSINDVIIGEVSVKKGDKNGALVDAINKKTKKTGVTAEVDEVGLFSLKSEDGRAIKIDGDLSKLAKLNIVDEAKIIKEEPISTRALFSGGDTLTSYKFSLDGVRKINRIEITEFDGDNGYYNVYIQKGKTKESIAKNVLASGDNVYKTNVLSITPLLADTIIIKPLDSKGREDKESGLGGWWQVRAVAVDTNIDALITVGKLTIEQENTLNYVTSKDLTYFTENKEREVIKEKELSSSEIANVEDVSSYKDLVKKRVDSYKEILTKAIDKKREVLSGIDKYVSPTTYSEASFEPSRAAEIVKSYGETFTRAQEVRNTELVYKLLFDQFDSSLNRGASGGKKSSVSKMFVDK